jgi:hypothetical protein
MENKLKDEIVQELSFFVWSGFYSPKFVLSSINDMFLGEEIDQNWLCQNIDSIFIQKEEEEKKWHYPTDVDRLHHVFDNLVGSNIIPLHNAGYTRQDGEGDAHEIFSHLKNNGIHTDGYCFYHGQDIEKCLKYNNLLLAFGSFKKQDSEDINIGFKIVDLLKKENFNVIWNGSPERRIHVEPFLWQKKVSDIDYVKDMINKFLKK